MFRTGAVLCIQSFLLCLQHIISQEIPPVPLEERELPDGVNEGIYYDEGYAFYVHPIEEEPDPVACYTCHYSRTSKHEQGMTNCDDPFNEKSIPIISCKGQCAVTRTTLAPDDYMIIRSCLPNCKDLHEPDSSVECCEGERCNGRKAGSYILASSLGVVGAVFIAGLLFSLCYFKPT